MVTPQHMVESERRIADALNDAQVAMIEIDKQQQKALHALHEAFAIMDRLHESIGETLAKHGG